MPSNYSQIELSNKLETEKSQIEQIKQVVRSLMIDFPGLEFQFNAIMGEATQLQSLLTSFGSE